MAASKQVDLFPEAQAQEVEVAELVSDWAGKKRGKAGLKSFSPSRVKRINDEMRVMMETKDWTSARAVHLVALYAWCHGRVYGIQPSELVGTAWAQAACAADRMVKRDYDGNVAAAVGFVRWAWQREAFFEKKRREGTSDSHFRLTWRFQFSPQLVTDYRLDKARREGFTK